MSQPVRTPQALRMPRPGVQPGRLIATQPLWPGSWRSAPLAERANTPIAESVNAPV